MGNAIKAQKHSSYYVDEYNREVFVGPLRHEAVRNPQDLWPVSSTGPFIFISHTGCDGVKEMFGWPTRWFLKTYLGVNVFLDDGDACDGVDSMLTVMEAAHRCTHAVILFSPRFRHRKYPVMELNTFIERRQEPNFSILPFLWNVDSLKGYAETVESISYTRSKFHDPANFMIRQLWPKLIKYVGSEVANEGMDLTDCLLRYIEDHRGTVSIPPDLESFYRRHDLAKSTNSWKESVTSIVPLPNPDNAAEVFLSHTGRDEIAATLARDMYLHFMREGVNCFLDVASLPAGQNWETTIIQGVEKANVFIAVQTPNYYFRYWCMKELDIAIFGGLEILPVLYVGDFDENRFVATHRKDVDDVTVARWLKNVKHLRKLQAATAPSTQELVNRVVRSVVTMLQPSAETAAGGKEETNTKRGRDEDNEDTAIGESNKRGRCEVSFAEEQGSLDQQQKESEDGLDPHDVETISLSHPTGECA